MCNLYLVLLAQIPSDTSWEGNSILTHTHTQKKDFLVKNLLRHAGSPFTFGIQLCPC